MESESKVHIYLDSEYATDSKSDVKTVILNMIPNQKYIVRF